MTINTDKNPRILDEKDKKLLVLLQKNGRESLTNLAKAIGLSIDATNKRIKKLQETGVIHHIGAFIDPKAMGFPLVADVKIKIHNTTEEEMNKFIHYLKNHPNVIELISVFGDYDITCIFIARDSYELEKVFKIVRQKFSHLIAEWRGMLVLNIYKFEVYQF